MQLVPWFGEMELLSRRISVVVPVFNDPIRLEFCLDALERQSLGYDFWEVIVVDNGFDRRLKLGSRPFRLVPLYCEVPGSYAARNRALGYCSGDVVAFTDADCLPQPDWLVQGLLALDDPNVDLLAGAVKIVPSSVSSPSAADLLEINFGFRQDQYVAHGAYGATANLFVRRNVLERLRGFDDRRKSGADRDFGLRARRAGFRIRFSPLAVVCHPARDSTELLLKSRRVIGGRLDAVGGNPFLRLRELLLHSRPLLRETAVALSLPLSWRQRIALMKLLLLCRWEALLEWLRLCVPHSTSLR